MDPKAARRTAAKQGGGSTRNRETNTTGKADDEYAQGLLLNLYELQRTMDPLIAAKVYNNRFCPLTRLPEELLMCIFNFLCDDVLALQCLRIVSRTFLRLLYVKSAIWKDDWYCTGSLSLRGNAFYLHDDLRPQFRRLLHRNSRCDNCRCWNNAAERPLFDDCKFQQVGRSGPPIIFHPTNWRKLHCDACHSLHDVCQISSINQQSSRPKKGRSCLGQQGSVQLCEHVYIY